MLPRPLTSFVGRTEELAVGCAGVEAHPLVTIIGPPGVGKTRLVRDLVLDTLTENSSARLLLTAQSNAAVNHLMDELADSLKGAPREPVIVRSQSKDNKDDAGKS